MILCDPAAERAVISGLCSYGDSLYIEVADIVSENSFTIDSNVIIFKCIKHIFNDESTQKHIDIASIYSAAQELNLFSIISKKEEALHLKAILDFPVNKENVLKFAAKIKKLEIARLLHKKLDVAKENLTNVNGSEPISKIIGMAEDPIFDFSASLADDSNIVKMGDGLEDYITHLQENKIDQVGIPTGFPIYDQAIGGGLRKSTINIIAARPKTGKTLLVDNMGFHIASKLNIPVLNMDTEMTKEDHVHRILAMSSEIEISSIETGKFAESVDKLNKIKESSNILSNIPLYYKGIAGKPFEEQLAIMRRWVVKDVGLNSDGSAKDCVIFYDYLKLMDTQGLSQDLKEYQILGFMMTSLHNFASKYKVPIVAFIQLNRDGITKESTDAASGSDRIIWLCSNFTIFKRKTDEEIAEDGVQNGNRKLVPVISRHGGGLDDNDYINCHMKGWCAKITEGRTRLEIVNNVNAKNKKDGFIIDDSNNDEKDKIQFV
jgi:replicative DNA helicase